MSLQALIISDGWLEPITQVQVLPSPFFAPRECDEEINLLVVHNISLPAGRFGERYIDDLFLGKLDCTAHDSFCDLIGVEVSAHCLIRRDGSITQYVSFLDKAWHAGVSSFQGRERCNDYSIGIELEGTDDIPYTEQQYQGLAALTLCLQNEYPGIIMENIVGHCDIAPIRKTDPGKVFDWHYFRQQLCEKSIRNRT
ncbi:1,6-anhydro-N-acetylmuramyl-L-alanine amidase AmpD [Colwellia sp. E2M01]|uniref:1,6-anhydro-N-acetylmuramyl-L-alanine amidase AmpD n=1 Tax=Colwellia sp. E2M01 TaxID=2841561 RepID=UPI001C0A1999|nr:1,6-anhydro-N-acetylmuramyl-L-alanine amidase AmpD [Colwellia sp. E2M01]MBU2871153.1 1,6-anhydro-N-acetylmuramyl-L-alanine amidase AmpD [Colwellia sp. E2M01]